MKNSKLNVKSKIILGICAHPDDLDFGASGTFAKWIRDGAVVYYLICTDGSKGSDDPEMQEEKLVKIRKNEQIEAGKVLGLKGIFFLNYKDTQLNNDLPLKRDITKYIRILKPDIVVTLDPTFVYSLKYNFINHTDHRAVGMAVMDSVFPLARDRLIFPEHEKEGLTPHKVEYLYFINFENYNEVIDISKTFDLKLLALSKHASQIKEEQIKRNKERAHTIGQKKGYKYAESFVKIKLP